MKIDVTVVYNFRKFNAVTQALNYVLIVGSIVYVLNLHEIACHVDIVSEKFRIFEICGRNMFYSQFKNYPGVFIHCLSF